MMLLNFGPGGLDLRTLGKVVRFLDQLGFPGDLKIQARCENQTNWLVVMADPTQPMPAETGS